MSNSKDNVLTMIDAFVAFKTKGDFSEAAADDLLRIYLDNSKLPVANVAELAQTDDLLAGTGADNPIWNTPDDLFVLVTTYPPVLLVQLLIIGMAIHVLRHLGDMNSETAAFEEFFAGWGCVVV